MAKQPTPSPKQSAIEERLATTTPEAAVETDHRAEDPPWGLIAMLLVVLVGPFFWAYWHTLVQLYELWSGNADYSHGFLVVPIALLLLWVRRDSFPGCADQLSWGGLIPLAGAIVVRYVGAAYHLDPVDSWSIPLWVAGVVWMFFGLRVLVWALPSIIFLWFMTPWPYRIETAFRWRLQRIATEASSWGLQFLGLPAFAQSNIILIDDQRLLVVEACSGLRIFVGVIALAYATIFLIQRPFWQKFVILLSAVPIALAANSIRIIITGLLYQWVSGETGRYFSHEFGDYFMIVLAAAMFFLLVLYMTKLFPEEEVVDMRTVLREQAASAPSS